MTSKNESKVLIGGQIYTLSGYESEEYLQRVALYINKKMEEVRSSENGKKMSSHLQSVLLALNIADDYFKVKGQVNDKMANTEAIIEENQQLKENMAETEALSKEIQQLQESLHETVQQFEEKERDYRHKIERYENQLKVDQERIKDLEETLQRNKEELDEYISLFEESTQPKEKKK